MVGSGEKNGYWSMKADKFVAMVHYFLMKKKASRDSICRSFCAFSVSIGEFMELGLWSL